VQPLLALIALREAKFVRAELATKYTGRLKPAPADYQARGGGFPAHHQILKVHFCPTHAVCELSPGTINTHLLINRAQPPFDNPDLRRGRWR
jgi:hypothetical protein